MIAAGAVLPAAVVGQAGRVDVELVGQAVHSGRRRAGQVIGDEAKPGQGAVLQAGTELVGGPPVLVNQPPPIILGQGEVGDEVLGGDLGREARQLG